MEEVVSSKEMIEFFENNQEKFYRIAYSYLKNSANALDVVHDSIVKALQKRGSIKHHEYFETWFYRILINECLIYTRKNKKLIFYENFDEIANNIPQKDNKNNYIDLYKAIDHLAPKLKTVIILRYFEDMKLEDIAKITKTNLSTTKSRLYKAIKIMKIDMEGKFND